MQIFQDSGVAQQYLQPFTYIALLVDSDER